MFCAQCPAHIHQLSRTQLPTDDGDSQWEAGGFRTNHTSMNFHLPPIQELPVSTAVLKINSSQEALSKDLSKHCQHFDAKWEQFLGDSLASHASPGVSSSDPGSTRLYWVDTCRKMKEEVFKSCSHLTQCFGWAKGKEAQVLPLTFHDLSLPGAGLGGNRPCTAPREHLHYQLLWFSHISNEQGIFIWTQLTSCLHPQSKGTRRMKEKLTHLLNFHQHSSQKCSLLPSVRNANISIFMPLLGNFVGISHCKTFLQGLCQSTWYKVGKKSQF